MAQQKTAKFGARASDKKRVVIPEHKFDDGHPLAWRFGRPDRGGPFAWNIADGEKFREIMHKLFEFEDKNWNEIMAGGSHPIPVERLCDAARARLVEIERDDLDELLSLRLTGANRVWCIKNGHILRPLWWDEHHQVVPVPKDRGDRKKERRRKGK